MPINFFQWRSLKTRVTLLTLAIFLISTWALAFYSSHMQRKEMQRLLGNQQFSMATFIAQYVTEELDKRINSMEVAATLVSPAVQQGDMNALYELLKQRPIFQSHFNAGIFITGIEGIAIADAPLSTGRIGVNFSDKDYLIGAVKEEKATIGKPTMDPFAKAPVFVIAVPIRDADGKVIGALMGVTDLSKPNFLDKIAENRYGKTGGYLLNAPRHRVIIAATDKRRIMQPTPAPGINPLYDRYTQGFEGFGIAVNSLGVEELTAAKQIPVADWLIIVKIPTAESFAPINAIQRHMLLITSLMILLAGGMTWWMVRRQLAPMLTAVRKLDTQSGSNLPLQPLPITRQDEVGNLIGGFNHLLETLAQREEALLENQKRLADIIEFLPDATFAIDKEGRVIIWNKAIEKMTGILASEMIGNGDHAYTIPFYGVARPQLMDLIYEDREEIASLYPHIIREGDTLITEAFCNSLYSNKGAWIFAKASPLRDQVGNIIGAIESIRDITERRWTEDALRESEARFKALHNASFGGICIHDKGIILECNQGLSEMTGYSTDELIGMNGLLLISEKTRDMVLNNIISGYEKAYEAIGLRKNNEEYPLRLEARNIPYKGKNVRTVEFRDITEIKQKEEEKIKLESKLQQAQKMEAVGQLAGGVAHDFNNMLGVIIGYSELILEQMTPSQKFHAELEEIQKAARRSADLTRQLLTFARKQTVAPKVLDLNQTIEGMLNMLRRLLGENINLIWMPGTGLWLAKIDPSQLDQILANLCVNARDAIPGVGKITVETENATFDEEYCATHVGSIPGEYVRIAVSDTGSGMDKETLSHIFEPFFTTKGVGEGTGLGLATVYGAVKQNNGFINVYSESEQGTTFTIYIPRHVAKTTQTRTTDFVKPVLQGNETILLVEDEPTILNMTRTLLERLGYTVLTARAPGEAIRLASEFAGQIHLLATDVIMPEMNGRQLAERLMECWPEMKTLYMSGYTANIIANQGVLKEGVSFIQKPFSKNELADKVREALES